MTLRTFRRFSGLFLCVVLFAGLATAAEVSTSDLAERIEKIEERLEQKVPPAMSKWLERITLSGAVETEASWAKVKFDDPAVDDEESSDLVVATVALGVDVEAVKHVSGHLLLLWEEDESDGLEIDEGFIRLDGEDVLPLYLQAGRMYVPFGNFTSNMVSDPLTLELGETRETALQLGFEKNGFYGSVFVFNGDVDEEGDDNHIDDFGANLGYLVEKEDFTFDVGVSFVNNLIDSDTLSDFFDEDMEGAEAEGYTFSLSDNVPGLGAYAVLGMGSFTLIGEVVTALDEPGI